ncbi:MAG: T9SS type A sorting domain-containing protein, partial [Bacteroidales bacterium]|nr:T9SS type A sorting domain-containing protein [Bacteroidales bacterium]
FNIINEGETEYNNIKAVISCKNELVTISDAEATIANIGANGSITITDEFEFSVDESIEYKTELYFDLNIYENETVIASSILQIDVKGSELDFASFIVRNDDNENGILEAGETADLGVVLNNLGNEIAVKVKGNLSSSNNDITINQTEAEFSTIGANSSGVAFFNVTLSENIGSTLNIPFVIKASDFAEKEYEFTYNYASTCTYIFQLMDSYSDGWNGAALLVKYDSGRPTDTLTIKYGGFEERRISIESNVEVTLEWMGKDEYDKECTFVIATEYYTAVYSSPALSQTSSFLYSWVNDCSCKNEYNEMCDAVKELKAEQTENSIVLSWSADNGQQTTVYEVYRGTKLLGTTEETTFIDESSANGEYVYSVRAIYEDCQGLFSDITVQNTVAIDENSAITASIYPNPSKDNFTIVCDDMTYISIYNVIGNKVMEANVDGNNYVVNDLESGVYFVDIKTSEGNIVKRIVKL